MSAKKMGLGRGLDSLIPTDVLDESFDPTAEQDEQVSDLRNIRISEIIPDPDQPRRNFDEIALEELAASIKAHGILQPIVVTPYQGKYMIVAGERRYRAALRAELERVPVLVRTLSNQHKLELSLIENLQRRDLNPLETATAYLKLRDQFNLSLDEIGQRVGGKSPAAVSNTLRLLRLPESVRNALADGRLREGQARPLISLEPEIIEALLPRILAEEWSARTIEQQANAIKRGTAEEKKTVIEKKSMVNPYHTEAERFAKRFAVPVRVKTSAKGAGQIVISFKNEAEFRRLEKLLQK